MATWPTHGSFNWDPSLKVYIDETAAESVGGSSTDAGVAFQVNNGVLTQQALADELERAGGPADVFLSGAYVLEGAAFADIGKQAGVDPTGVTECAAAIQTALDATAALGWRAYAKGTFKIASTVTVTGNADLGEAVFNYTATSGTALRVGTTTVGTYLDKLQVRLPKTVLATAKTVAGWAQVAGTVGVELNNLTDCTIDGSGGNIKNFETGFKPYAYGVGANYNEVHIPYLENNKINMYMGADTTGSMNESNYYGGHFAHYSSEGTNVAGTRHLEMKVCTNPINNNRFYGPSLEGDTPQYHLVMAGTQNRIIQGRYEVTGGARLYWQTDATRNLIDGGYAATAIVETFAAGATRTNRLHSAGKEVGSLDGGTSGQYVYEAGTATDPILVGMDPGARVAGTSPATGYRWQVMPDGVQGKRAADSFPRIYLDFVNGRVYLGNGTYAIGPSAAAKAYFTGTSTGTGILLTSGHLYFSADNTFDLGDPTLRPRDGFFGRNVTVGGNLTLGDAGNIVVNATTGTKIGTATTQKLGFWNATPIVRPSAYTQTYSTADKTVAARTAAALTDNIAGTVGTTLAAVPDPADAPATADALRDDLVTNVLPKIRDALSSLADQIGKNRTDELDSTQALNSIIDDLQAIGLVG